MTVRVALTSVCDGRQLGTELIDTQPTAMTCSSCVGCRSGSHGAQAREVRLGVAADTTRLQVQDVALVQLVPVVRALRLYTPLIRVLQHHVTCTDRVGTQSRVRVKTCFQRV